MLAASLAVVFGIAAIPTARAQNGAVSFTSSNSIYSAETYQNRSLHGPGNLVAGYFNHDKQLDFVFGGTDSFVPFPVPFLDIALNRGNGTYAVSTIGNSPTGDGPNLAADLNGDGNTDLVYYGAGPLNTMQGINIWYSDGHGGFPTVVNYPVDNANSVCLFAVAGDFNDDGKMDLAVVTSASTLVVLLNEGSEKFRPAYSYSIPTIPGASGFNTAHFGMVAGELNGDYKADLALIYGGAKAAIIPFFATNGGALKRGGTYSLSASLSSFGGATIGDVNKDGYGDVAVATDSGVRLMLGSSSGAFRTGAYLASGAVPCAAPSYEPHTAPLSCVVLADFNKDGKVDLAVATAKELKSYQSTNGAIYVYPGLGDGAFSTPTVYSAANEVTALLAADAYGAGNTDLITADGYGSVSILRNNGSGRFDGAIITPSPSANGMVTADFNHDGKPDLAVVDTANCKAPCSGAVTVFPGTNSTYFGAGKRYSIGMHGSAIAAGDLNGDGVKDLVVVNATAGDDADTSVLLGNKDGTFQSARNYKLGSLSNDAFLADANKDGKLDLVEDGGVALGKGNGTFGPLTPFPGGLGFDVNAHFGVGDFNGDGSPDVAFGNVQNDSCNAGLQILFGNGAGQFSSGPLLFGTPAPIRYVTAGHLHPGKYDDVVVSGGASGPCGGGTGYDDGSGIMAYLNNGNDTFTPAGGESAEFEYLLEAGPVAIADFNGDGRNDIGVSDPANNRFVVLTGNGDGTFNNHALFTATNLPQNAGTTAGTAENGYDLTGNGIAVADFDHNGLPDVVLSSSLGVSRLYSQRVPTVSPSSLQIDTGFSQTVTVKNTLGTAQTISAALEPSIEYGINPIYSITANTCNRSISPGASCKVTVKATSYNSQSTRGDLVITDSGNQIYDVPITQ